MKLRPFRYRKPGRRLSFFLFFFSIMFFTKSTLGQTGHMIKSCITLCMMLCIAECLFTFCFSSKVDVLFQKNCQTRKLYNFFIEKLYKLLYGFLRLEQIIIIKKALLQSIFGKHRPKNENEICKQKCEEFPTSN